VPVISLNVIGVFSDALIVGVGNNIVGVRDGFGVDSEDEGVRESKGDNVGASLVSIGDGVFSRSFECSIAQPVPIYDKINNPMMSNTGLYLLFIVLTAIIFIRFLLAPLNNHIVFGAFVHEHILTGVKYFAFFAVWQNVLDIFWIGAICKPTVIST